MLNKGAVGWLKPDRRYSIEISALLYRAGAIILLLHCKHNIIKMTKSQVWYLYDIGAILINYYGSQGVRLPTIAL